MYYQKKRAPAKTSALSVQKHQSFVRGKVPRTENDRYHLWCNSHGNFSASAASSPPIFRERRTGNTFLSSARREYSIARASGESELALAVRIEARSRPPARPCVRAVAAEEHGSYSRASTLAAQGCAGCGCWRERKRKDGTVADFSSLFLQLKNVWNRFEMDWGICTDNLILVDLVSRRIINDS